jgi:hypothetical protein
MTYANDGRFHENCAVLVRYPRTPEQEKADRESWPWLPGSVLEQCGPDQWRICVEVRELTVREDGSKPRRNATGQAVLPLLLPGRLRAETGAGQAVVRRKGAPHTRGDSMPIKVSGSPRRS